MQNVQIFGTKNSSATRAAERFFKERRVAVQFVDLKQKAMAAGEIRRFIERFTLAGLVDTDGKAYTNAGVQYLRLTDADWLARFEREPELLRLPLVRCGKLVSIGSDTTAWQSMAESLKATAR